MARTRKSAQVPEFVPAPVVGAGALKLLRRVLAVVHAGDLEALKTEVQVFLETHDADEREAQ